MHLSNLSRQTFVQYFGNLYENATWVAERVHDKGLALEHDDPDALFSQFAQVFDEASEAEKLVVLKSHSDLAGSSADTSQIASASIAPQSVEGLDRFSTKQLERLNELNRMYRSKFDFPFVIDVQGMTADALLKAFTVRLHKRRQSELPTAFAEVQKIARSRLDALLRNQIPDVRPLAIPVTQVGRQPAIAATHNKPTEVIESGARTTTAGVEQRLDADYFPGITRGLPLGIQHVLVMFVANVMPAIIISGAMGFGLGSADPGNMIYLIQMSMLFAGVATLIQSISLGPVGARLPVMQGTSFAFIPVMIPIAIEFGMAALMGSIVIVGVFHFFLGTFIGRIRHCLPPLVTGLVVLMISLALIKLGIQYAAGGVPMIDKPDYGGLVHWSMALVVIAVALILKVFARGIVSVSAVLVGLLAGYAFALYLGLVDFGGVQSAAWFSLPDPRPFGMEFNAVAVVGMCLIGFVCAIASVDDIAGIAEAGGKREATSREITGGSTADGLSTAIAGLFGALPNSPVSQNIRLVELSGYMSRHIVTLGAIILIACGLVPKFGAAIQTIPVAVLGGGMIVMFSMLSATGVNILSEVVWNRRNMMIFGTALSVGLGLQLEPQALQHLPQTATVLMTSGLLPSALIAIVLNFLLPHYSDDERLKPVQAGT